MCLICSSSGTKEHNFLMLVHEFREKKWNFLLLLTKILNNHTDKAHNLCKRIHYDLPSILHHNAEII